MPFFVQTRPSPPQDSRTTIFADMVPMGGGQPGSSIMLLSLLLLGIRIFRRVTLYEFQRGLKYTSGRFKAVLPPG